MHPRIWTEYCPHVFFSKEIFHVLNSGLATKTLHYMEISKIQAKHCQQNSKPSSYVPRAKNNPARIDCTSISTHRFENPAIGVHRDLKPSCGALRVVFQYKKTQKL